MQSCFRTLMAVVLVLTGACTHSETSSSIQVEKIHGSGTLAEETRDVTGFTSLTHKTEGAVYIDQVAGAAFLTSITCTTLDGDGELQIEDFVLGIETVAGEALLVRAEDNLLPYLITEVQGSVLVLRTSSGVDVEPTLPIEFFLTVTSLEGVTLQGIGSIHADGLSTASFAVTCSGVGTVELPALSTNDLDVTLSGIGSLRASGDVDRQVVRLSGLGSYDTEDLQSREAHVLVEGFGSATVRVSDLLVAVVKSSGSVYYIGNPTVEATITGTGTVEPIEE